MNTYTMLSKKIRVGDLAPSVTGRNANGERIILLPDCGFVHLQFRRFAGCPICNLHLQSFRRSHDLLKEHGIREIVIFHSDADQLKKYTSEFPFVVISDPDKRLYQAFGVEESLASLGNPTVWPTILKGVIRSIWETVIQGKPIPPLKAPGGNTGLPADFLIDTYGVIMACKYGKHADDQWSIAELITVVKKLTVKKPCLPTI